MYFLKTNKTRHLALHGAVNSVLAEAGHEAGYAVLEEQVVPALCTTKSLADGSFKVIEARLDVELFLHPVAPDRLLDATVRHPTAQTYVRGASTIPGVAARRGVDDKARRYPPRAGKSVLCCAAETFGRIDEGFDCFLDEMAVLASRRQRDRGVQPTRWKQRWRTLLSIRLAIGAAAAILKGKG